MYSKHQAEQSYSKLSLFCLQEKESKYLTKGEKKMKQETRWKMPNYPNNCNVSFYNWNDGKGHICNRPKDHVGKHSENGRE